MILMHRTSGYRSFEKILLCLWDCNILYREDLKLLTGMSEDTFRHTIYKLNKRDPRLIRHVRTADKRQTYVFLLTDAGVAYCKDLVQWSGRVRVSEGQVYHSLGLNAILMRIFHKVGVKGYSWYSTREAADIIMDYIEDDKDLQKKVKDEKIRIMRPDALLAYQNGKTFIEYDTGSESGRAIKTKLRSYQQMFLKLRMPENWRQVVFVTSTKSRKKYLETLFNGLEIIDFEANFFIEGEETDKLIDLIKVGVRPSV